MVNGATGAFAAIIKTFLERPLSEGDNGEGVELLFPGAPRGGPASRRFNCRRPRSRLAQR